jgi:hypothetical protein
MSEQVPTDKITISTGRSRRILVYVNLIFSMGVIVYVLWTDKKHGMGETALIAAFMHLGAVTGGYVFNAAWQDVSAIKHRRERRSTRRGSNYDPYMDADYEIINPD